MTSVNISGSKSTYGLIFPPVAGSLSIGPVGVPRYWFDVSPPGKPDICYEKGDIRLQEYTVVQEKWPLVVTGKLQVMGEGWGSVCADGIQGC